MSSESATYYSHQNIQEFMYKKISH